MSPSGITVDGKPLEEVVKEIEGKEKGKEIGRERKDTIKKQGKCRVPVYRGMKYPAHRERNSPVRKLTIRQIKKEYGEMTVKTNCEKILRELQRNTYNSAKEIVEKTGVTKGSATSLLFKLKGLGFVTAFQIGDSTAPGRKAMKYSLAEEYMAMHVDNIYEKFLESIRAERAKKKEKVSEDPHPDFKIKGTQTGRSVHSESFIRELLENKLNVKVEVSGTIQIKFVFEKNDQD